MTPESIAQQLGDTGLCVCPNFLSPQLLSDGRKDLNVLLASGQFNRASVGKGVGREIRNGVRRDETFWLDRSDATDTQDLLWAKLELLKTAFNQTLFLGLHEIEGHYASYPVGGFYKRHLDCFHKDSARSVSLIVYLNENWSAKDGGQLRVYDKKNHTDIDPIGGTMVCFMSGESEHEVLTSHSARLSFSCWFKT